MNSRRSRVLLHLCCAGCSPHVVEVLRRDHDVTGYFYNPNIHPEPEYRLRLEEAERLAEHLGFELISGAYDVERWFAATKGLEHEPEGGARCEVCFRLRLEDTGQRARQGGFDAFTTTLTVSPHKNARLINAIGAAAGEGCGVDFLERDFKKGHGFVRTISLCREMGLYRQDYCGCLYSQRERSPSASEEKREHDGC